MNIDKMCEICCLEVEGIKEYLITDINITSKEVEGNGAKHPRCLLACEECVEKLKEEYGDRICIVKKSNIIDIRGYLK